jgi:hypothetical protein
MAIGFASSLDAAVGPGHDRAVDGCRGALCVADIWWYFVEREQRELNRKELERRCGFAEAGSDEKEPTNGTMGGWLRGKVAGEKSIAQVLQSTNQQVDLRRWIDHPLFLLLRTQPPSLAKLNALLETRSDPVRRILMLRPDGSGRFGHHPPERQTVLELRDLGGMDAFVAMLCLARRGEHTEHDPEHALPAVCAFDMFPGVVVSEPSLQFCWQSLSSCLTPIFWRRVYSNGVSWNLPLAELGEQIAARRRDPRAKHVPLSGRRLSRAEQLKQERRLLDWKHDLLRQQRNARRSAREFRRRTKALFDACIATVTPDGVLREGAVPLE